MFISSGSSQYAQNVEFKAPYKQSDSEIIIDDIINDESVDPMMSFIQDKHKVIPANFDSVFQRQTVYDPRLRNTWEEQNMSCIQKVMRYFSGSKKNQMTRFQMIEIRKRDLLNDYAYETNDKNSLSTKFSEFFDGLKVIDPDSLAYIMWQFINTVLVVFYFFEIPFIIFFQITEPQQHRLLQSILSVSLIIFALNIIVNLNTAFYTQGQMEFNRKLIIKSYLSSYFAIDILAIIALLEQTIFIDQNNNYKFIQVFFFLKIYEIQKSTQSFQEYLQLKRRLLAAYKLIQLFVGIIWLCSCFACFFNAVGEHSKLRGASTWFDKIEIKYTDAENKVTVRKYDNLRLDEKYLYSFYWATTTMISVGYGDITPQNPREVILTVLTMFCSCIVFAYSINAIWEVIRESSENKQKFQKYVNAIQRFMNDHNVNRKLKNKIEAYLSHMWEMEKTRDAELEQGIIQKLAPALREELMFDSYGKLLQSSDFFNKNFSELFLKELAEDIEEVNFSQGENIFKVGDIWDDFSIYYLAAGTIEISVEAEGKKNIKLNILKHNQIFGSYGFITGLKRTASAQCLTYSRVYKLSREKFLKKLEQYPEEKEKFNQLKHNIIFNNKFALINMKCWVCESQRHLAANCDKTHLVLNKYQIIRDYINQQNPRVKQFERFKRKMFQPLVNLKQLQQEAEVVQNYNKGIQFHESSEEQDEYSSDESDYSEELKDIKQRVEEVREQEKEQQQYFMEFDQSQKKSIDLDQPDQYQQEGLKDSQDLLLVSKAKLSFQSDEDKSLKSAQIPKPKGKSQFIMKKRSNERTTSMIQINEKRKRRASTKYPETIKDKKESPPVKMRRKMTSEISAKDQSESFDLLNKPPSAVIKKNRTVQINNKLILDTASLKQQRRKDFENERQNDFRFQDHREKHDHEYQNKNSPLTQSKIQEVVSDVESDFSIDKICNFNQYFENFNHMQIIQGLNKLAKRNEKRLLQQQRKTAVFVKSDRELQFE